jgi:molybdopterin synthase catalytic subunit
MISLTTDDFDPGLVIRAAKKNEMGAIVSFLGVVRDDGCSGVEVEAYPEVAQRELEQIAAEALEKFPIDSVDIIHRTGELSVGDNIVLIVVGAGHRREAFLGCEYVIERLKETVPIWKKEHTASGDRWVSGKGGHTGAERPR